MSCEFGRPVRIIQKVFPAVTTDKMFRKPFTKFQDITHNLMACMFNAGFKFKFLFQFRDIPSIRIVIRYNTMIGFTIWLTAESWRRHKLRVCTYRITAFAPEPGVSIQEFLPANRIFFFHRLINQLGMILF